VLTVEAAAGTDRLDLHVYADEKAGQARLIALLDNLGKGAAGAAVQNLNIALGLPETEGLRL
jgi:N-acetyl-gamma-glutamyl-phosphate reductase